MRGDAGASSPSQVVETGRSVNVSPFRPAAFQIRDR
jgi:hypothetical protein